MDTTGEGCDHDENQSCDANRSVNAAREAHVGDDDDVPLTLTPDEANFVSARLHKFRKLLIETAPIVS